MPVKRSRAIAPPAKHDAGTKPLKHEADTASRKRDADTARRKHDADAAPRKHNVDTAPQKHDVDTEQRILDAAHEVFLKHGTAGARMQDIAREADVNQALLHYYFRSKDRLAEAVFRRAAMRLMPPVFKVLASAAPLEDKVRDVVALELDQLSRSPHLPGYLLAELNQRPERAAQLLTAMTGLNVGGIVPGVFETVRRQIDECVRAGTMRPIRPEQFIINLLSLCIFPFAARPLLAAILRWDAGAFAEFIERRRTELPIFFFEGLRP